MQINRTVLLKQLIAAKHNGLVKILTGIRRCGKSYLLFRLFQQHLLESGVTPDHIIAIDLEQADDDNLLNPILLRKHIQARVPKDGKWTYVLLDEIQTCDTVLRDGVNLKQLLPEERDKAYITFYKTLSALRTMSNVDVYVTGSNSRMLSSDVATEFRGRGDVIHVTPFSFAEFASAHPSGTNTFTQLQDYLTYGGMPECLACDTPDRKQAYLQNLYTTIYLRDLVKRHKLHGDTALAMVTDAVMSMTGGLTNPTNLVNFINANMKFSISQPTVVKHLKYLIDAFLIDKAQRFDVRGKHYLDYPTKYYATDNGLRNARTGFRQIEYTHLMENTIFNELKRNGYTVDVGVVGLDRMKDGKHIRTSHEIDFVVNRGYDRIYIQSAWMIPDEEKMQQETFSLKHTGDNFRKVVIDGHPIGARYIDSDGIGHISLIDFLLDPKSIETI